MTGQVVLPTTEQVPDHWFVDSLVKVFPDDQPKEHRIVRPLLVAARNSHPSLQLALRAHQHVEGVTASVEGWDKTAARGIGGARAVAFGARTFPGRTAGEIPCRP